MMHIMQALARSCSGACFLGPVRELTAGDTLETVAPPSTAMLAPGAPRSEHDPERAVLAADTITMHRLTGTFTDPSHEQAFAAQLFGLAFPIHALVMTLSFLAVSVGDMHVAWSSPISPTVSQWGAWVTASLTLVLSLVRPA